MGSNPVDFYVGDMSVDEKFAKNAGVNFIFCNYGYESKNIKSKFKIYNFESLGKLI